ncbi:MAG: LytTR family DNA-binding domain-containing protein [Weeksellaceae bacterium]
MNCIIIEDEKPAARYLMRMLQKQGLEPAAVLNSVQEAVEWLRNNPDPDLIFLDIQLGDGVSFEIFEQIQPKSAIIFTTAYDEYALRAFKFNSIDYLLKPINESDLSGAIDKFRRNNRASPWDLMQLKALLSQNFENPYRERFLVKVGANLKTIKTENIACFYAKEKATYLFSEGREYPIESSLNDLESQLDPKIFFRISRNAIVNLKFIDKIISYSGSRFKLFVNRVEEELIVSRERVNNFKQWLEK